MAAAIAAAALCCGGPVAQADVDADTSATIRHMICRMVDGAATASGIPSGFLTRLIWEESRFRPNAVSPKGAQGVAQFMPQTAAERGLADPRDPQEAVEHAAQLLRDLRRRFGNLGLAAAAYNAGAARVEKWLAGDGGLPTETRNYVMAVTGRPPEEWTGSRQAAVAFEAEPCVSMTSRLAQGRVAPPLATHIPTAWQGRLDGTLTKAIEGLSSVEQQQRREAAAEAPRMPRTNMVAAQQLCDSLQILGASCKIFRR